ncbi:hypothetical protein P3T16_006910 [Paraburkholderia sp. GAS42]|jgi:hypothetical protein
MKSWSVWYLRSSAALFVELAGNGQRLSDVAR